MKFTDVVTLTQNAIAQAMGSEYMTTEDGNIKPLNSFKLVDVGKDVLDSGSVDSFVKALLSQIGKMVVDSKKYTAELPSIFVDSFDWGGYIERVYFSPQDIIADDMYNLVDGQSYDDHKFYKPNASAKIFEEAKAITCPISIANDQVMMAFANMEQMNAFISGIYTNVENTITLAMEAYAHMLISAGIAVSDKATNTAVHLLTEYNAQSGDEAITDPQTALSNPKFLIYAMRRIRQIRKYMQRYTTAFNNKSIPTFTTESDSNMALLSDFATACKFNVKADTFNRDEIGIGGFDEVSCWQAFNDDDNEAPLFDFATNSKIMIGADSENKLGIGTSAVTIENCIGVLYDHRAMGICPHKSKVTSSYTAVADFWNQYHHELVNYILDANYNIVAFILD